MTDARGEPETVPERVWITGHVARLSADTAFANKWNDDQLTPKHLLHEYIRSDLAQQARDAAVAAALMEAYRKMGDATKTTRKEEAYQEGFYTAANAATAVILTIPRNDAVLRAVIQREVEKELATIARNGRVKPS